MTTFSVVLWYRQLLYESGRGVYVKAGRMTEIPPRTCLNNAPDPALTVLALDRGGPSRGLRAYPKDSPQGLEGLIRAILSDKNKIQSMSWA